jgi:hypothetical protein
LVWISLFCISASAQQVGEVRLVFHDSAEYFVPPRDVDAVRLLVGEKDAGVELDYEQSSFTVPYGRYTLVVENLGFRSYERRIVVAQPKTNLLVALQLGDVSNTSSPRPPTRIAGRVKGKGLDFSTAWVKALPVFGAGELLFDSRLDENGRFSITLNESYEAESSKYVVVVLGPKRRGSRTELHVVAMREVDVYANRTADVEITVR